MKKYAFEIVGLVLILALGIGVLVQTNRLNRSVNKYDALTNTFEAYKLDAQAQVQAEQQRRIDGIEEVKNEARKVYEQIQAESQAAAATALNERNSVYERKITRLRATCNTTAAAGSETTSDPIGVLAHVLTSADKRAGVLAEYADRSRAAGLACEAAYEVVTGGSISQPPTH